MNTNDRVIRARKRAEAKLDFYKHLIVFLVINLMLFAINFITSPDYFWSVWPLMGWGVAVVIHAFSVFVFGVDDKIIERMVEDEMRKGETNRL